MSKHNFAIFPTPIASALHRAIGSYLVPNGAAVRHANGYQEILVSYPQLDVAYPEDFPLYFEGFRDAESAPVEPEVVVEVPVIEETKEEDEPKDPVEAPETPVTAPKEEGKETITPEPFAFPTTASIAAAKKAAKAAKKASE